MIAAATDTFGNANIRSILCGKLTVSEQIKAFSGATVIIGVEGACLTNTMFMRSNSIVINLQPAKDDYGLHSRCGFSYFWQLAQLLSLQYYAFLLPEYGWLDAISVPIERFAVFLGNLNLKK